MEHDDMAIAQILNHIGNLYLQRGDTKQMINVFADALRLIRRAGHNESELVISGFNFYGISKLHPENAAAA
jgi:hypothetical protein